MSSVRATIYLAPSLYKALKFKSAETSTSISELVNMSIKTTLAEDMEDLAAFKECQNEPLVSFEKILANLKKDGRI